MNSKISNLLSSSLMKDSAKLASSNFLLYLLPFIVTPLLSRMYDPSYFGEWGVFSSTYQIIYCILFLCYDYVIVKAEESEFSSVCGLTLVVSVLLMFVSFLAFVAGKKMNIPFFSEFPSLLLLLFMLLFSSIGHVLHSMANRQEMYWVMSSSGLVLGVTQAILRIIFAICLLFPNGLIAGTVFAQMTNCLFLLLFVRKVFSKQYFESFSFSNMWRVALKYKNFPLYDAPATLLLFSAINMPVLILSMFFDKNEIGCVSIIFQMLLLPISLIGSAVGKVYYRQIIDLNDDAEVLVSTKMIKMVSVLSLLPIGFVILGGDYLVNLFLGEKWSNAGNIAICLVIWSVPNILTQPLIPKLRKDNKQNFMFVIYLISFIMSISGILISCCLDFNIYRALYLFSICFAVPNYVLFYYIVRRTNVDINIICNPIVLVLHVVSIVLITIRYNLI